MREITDKLKAFFELNEYKKVMVWGLFLLVGFFLIMQHSLIGMYFDDFGNASLSYSYDSSSIQGTNYTTGDLFDWAYYIYFNWGGRILYALTMIPMLKDGPQLYMMIQSVILLVVFIVMYKIIKRYCAFRDEPAVVLALITFYGLLNGTILTWGMYWASASILYLWPILPFFVAIYIYEESAEAYDSLGAIPDKNYIYLLILIPLITLSQEQMGGAFIVWILCRVICRISTRRSEEKGKLLYFDIYILVWALATFMVFILAPGNWNRLEATSGFAELSVFEKIQLNYPILMKLLTDYGLYGVNIIIWLAGIMMIYMLYQKKKCRVHIVFFCGMIPYGLNVCSMLSSRIFGIAVFGETYNMISFTLLIIDMFFILLFFFYERKQLEFMAIMIAAVAYVFCLLFSPTLNLRSCILYVFICMIMSIIVGYTFWKSEKNRIIKAASLVLAAGIVLVSGLNLGRTYNGYKQNYYINEYNFNLLKNYNGVDKVVYLKDYANAIYRAPMPCDEGYEYCAFWMKEYFDMPMDVEFIWQKGEISQ